MNEVDGQIEITGLTVVMGYLEDVANLCTSVWNLLTSNVYFSLCLAVGLVSVGIGIFRRVKRVARR